MYRGLIHFHSNYSYDSILSINKIVKFALKNNLNFLILTDHDTIEGSLKLKAYIDEKQINIEVLIAAEYNTEYGDIIALNIKKEIKNMKFDNFINEVKEQGGILLFPHPYKGHKEIEFIAQKVDMIEVFNARTGDNANRSALTLANKYNKKSYYASDAHTYLSLKNAIIEFPKQETYTHSILNSDIKLSKSLKSFNIEIIYSQFIKSIKIKRLKLLVAITKSFIKQMIVLKIFKRV